MISPGCWPDRPAAAAWLDLVEVVREAGVEGVEGGVGRLVARSRWPGRRPASQLPPSSSLRISVCTVDVGVPLGLRCRTARAQLRFADHRSGRALPGGLEGRPGAAGDQGQALVGLGVVGLDPGVGGRVDRGEAAVLDGAPPRCSVDSRAISRRPAGPAARPTRPACRRLMVRRKRRASQTWPTTTAARTSSAQRPRRPGRSRSSIRSLGPVGVGRDQVVQDRQGVGAELGAGRLAGTGRRSGRPCRLLARACSIAAGVARRPAGSARPGPRRRPAGLGPPRAISVPAAVRAWSYAARCAGGSSPPTRNALVAVASAISRLVWICCTRISWAVSASARSSE